MKAVVWTDVIQTVAMFGALIVVAVRGTMNVGGSGTVFSEAWNTGRIEAPMYVNEIIFIYFLFYLM